MNLTTEIDDIKAIQSLCKGDKISECLLYEKYRKILFTYIKNKYPNDTYIDDHVSDILIKVFTNIKTFDPERGDFKKWVFSIAKNHMIDNSRSSYYINSTNTVTLELTTTATDDSEFEYLSTYSTGAEYNNFDNESSITFVSSQMKGNDFSMLNMHYSMGYSYKEIGAEFNMTSNTVSNRVNRVKTKLKNSIGEDTIL